MVRKLLMEGRSPSISIPRKKLLMVTDKLKIRGHSACKGRSIYRLVGLDRVKLEGRGGGNWKPYPYIPLRRVERIEVDGAGEGAVLYSQNQTPRDGVNFKFSVRGGYA